MDSRLSSMAIFDWLGVRPHDADFELVACERCAHQALADHEHLRVYTDPTDPRAFSLNIAGESWPACRGCGAPDWNFIPATTIAPEWQWVSGDK